MPGFPRVLVLNERDLSHPKAGGAEIHVTEVFGRLAAQGWEITLAASGFSGGAARDTLRAMAVERFGGLPFYYPRAAAHCARETRAGRFDVVVECLNKLPFFAPVYSTAPVLALCHHLFGKTAFQQVAWPIAASVFVAERMIPRLYRRSPFVVISESTRDDLASRGVEPARIEVQHCGIARPQPAAIPASQRAPKIAYVGRLEPYKRVDLMLRAAAQLRSRVPDLEILIIGRGADQPRLERIAAEVGVSECTRFCGFVSDADRDRLLAECRICVCPSLKEGWGLTVIEANALGTPVVASDAPGLRDSVIDGETGFLVAGDDADAFARRMGDLLTDDTRVDALGSAALAWSARFDWDVAADAMAASLEHTAGRR
jgi:glycosyltransferase involved in cell wall biosynthesis